MFMVPYSGGGGGSSSIRRWIDQVSGKIPSISLASGGDMGGIVRQNSEAIGVGVVLGAIHAQSKTGLDVGGIPVDGALAAAGCIAAAFGLVPGPYRDDAKNVGSHALTVLSFRKTAELMEKKNAASSMAGESDVGEEDPIVAAAKNL